MNCIDRFRHEVKSRLHNHRFFDWREEIPSEVVETWRQELVPHTRQRLWTVELMLWFWIWSGLHREKSFSAAAVEVWGPLCAELPELANFRLNDGRMAEGRARVPLRMIQWTRDEFARRGVEEGRDMGLWRGRRVVWVDGTTVSMEDTPSLRAHFGSSKNQHGESPFPLARLLMWGVAATRIVIGSAWGPSTVSEKELALRSIDCLRMGDVMVMDRTFATAELFAEIRRRGADAITKKHPQLKLKKHPRRRIGPYDWIVELALDPSAYERDSTLPATLLIRVFKAKLQSGQTQWMQTTLLDPERYPAQELANVYVQRWGAETSYAEVKQDLHLEVARSQTVEGAGKEIEAHLAAYNYVRLQMLRAARQAGADPLRLSFRNTVRLLELFTQRSRMPSPSSLLWHSLMCQIAAGLNPSRFGRHELRAVKRQSKPYPRLKGQRKKLKPAV